MAARRPQPPEGKSVGRRDEPRSFAAIASVLAEAGLAPAHSHLEVYLGDPRRTDPAKLKTVLLRELR